MESVPIGSGDTSRLDHPSRKALTCIAAQWRGRVRKIWRELSSGGRIFPIYLRRNARQRSRLNGRVAQRCWRRVSADVPETTVAAAAASRVASRAAFWVHEESSVGEQSACREAGLRFGGSDAGPSAAARLRHGSSTPQVHRESSFLSSADVRDTEETRAAAARESVGFGGGGRRGSTSRRTTATNVRVEERRRGGARRRRQDVGDVSVPDYPVAPMRLDPFGLTGPPTSKKWREEEQEEEQEQQLWLSSSSSLSSASFVECVRSDRAACRSYASSRSNRDCVVDDGGTSAARHHHEARNLYRTGHGPDEKAGTATAFRISRDFASRGAVRARTRDRHEDHEEDDNEGSDALRARTRVLLRADRPSPRQRRRVPPRFARRARRRSRRRRGSGAISEDGLDVATSAVSFVDVHAYTAYSDDRDDDDDGENDGDDDDDNEGRARCERRRIYGGSEEAYECEHDGISDDDAHASATDNPRDECEHENANEHASREDYTYTGEDTSSGVSKSDQWASQSSSFDRKKDRERIDGYGRGYPTVDEMFDERERRGGRCSERKRSHNTAWFQKPITRRKGRGGGEEGGGRTGDKPRVRRSYYRLLLFVLYLLAWPLLCSGSPSGHLASTFAQNPTLAHAKNPAQRGNTTPPDTLFSSPTVIENQYQHSQQYVQGSDYNTNSERPRHQQQQQRHPYNEYTWEMNQMNPWLSACDLAGPAPTDLQGSCGAPPPEVPKHCPKPCKNASKWIEDGGEGGSRHGGSIDEKKGEEQCLYYLEESHKKIICQMRNKSKLLRRLPELRLRHCCEHSVFNALTPGEDGPLYDVLNGGKKCDEALNKLLLVDALASRLHCEFEEVLARYDCAQPYSVIHNCTHCKDAYRKWVCSSLVPYFAHRNLTDDEVNKEKDKKTLGSKWIRLRPCRSFCQTVEQRCPYFLPGDRAPAYPTQYAGEPTFLCRDPNIPETGEQATRALHGISDDECCFQECPKNTSNLCTTCNPWKQGQVQELIPATAPVCEPPVHPPSGSTGPGSRAGEPETSTDRKPTDGGDDGDTSIAPSSTTTPPTTTQKDTAFCGSGRIGSISSASSPGRPSPPIVLQLFWLCSILIALPANALHYNAVSWSTCGSLRLFGSGLLLSSAHVLRRVFNDLLISFGSTGICRRAAVRCLLFVRGMPGRAMMKCRRRGWWWWRSWRRSSSRHFRWKFLRRSGVASVLRDVSIAVLELFLKFAARCRCRDWWWLWRRWRRCGSTGGGRCTKLVPRRRRPVIHCREAHRRRGRRGDLTGRLLRIDVASSAKSISRKDPP